MSTPLRPPEVSTTQLVAPSGSIPSDSNPSSPLIKGPSPNASNKNDKESAPLRPGDDSRQTEVTLLWTLWAVAKSVYTVAVRDLVLHTPQIYTSIALTFFAVKHISYLSRMDAYDAATFTAVASIAYYCIHPLFMKMFPEQEITPLWRRALDCSNTLFITSAFSHLWRLKINTIWGAALWAVTLGIPYRVLDSGRAHTSGGPKR